MITGRIEVRTRYDEGRAAALAGDVCQELVTVFVNDGVTAATPRTPVDTGRLRAATAGEVDAPGRFRSEGRMINRTAYALDVHDGTGPHVIEPRRASVLRFEAGGETVFATRVNHPGTAARPFLAEGAADAAAEHNFLFTPTAT